jgi:hypothetical protein
VQVCFTHGLGAAYLRQIDTSIYVGRNSLRLNFPLGRGCFGEELLVNPILQFSSSVGADFCFFVEHLMKDLVCG